MSSTTQLIAQALDTRRSVVVEACAGSGKTWLLVSRIVRTLLDGAKPGEILAITYTRKAAREIEERLSQWLELLAIGSDEQVRTFLLERGVPDAQIGAVIPRARGLFEVVQSAVPALTISTFHGWFARLVQGAPLASDLAGFGLHESGNQLKNEVWQLFADERAKQQDTATNSLLWLLENVGLNSTRTMLFQLADRRAEWFAFMGCQGGVVDKTATEPTRDPPVDQALARLREAFGVSEKPCAVSDFCANEHAFTALQQYAEILRMSDLAKDRTALEQANLALKAADAEARFGYVYAALLTKEGSLRDRKDSKAHRDRFKGFADQLLELHARLGEMVLDAEAQRQNERAYLFNRHALTAGVTFLDAFAQHKRERRLMDFADLELHVSALLSDDEQAAFLQARLDARYKHILLDEFQDTNPLQWQILLGWLEAYQSDRGDRGDQSQGNGANKPHIFVVGDPKQAIYRFRRADARVFGCAADFLEEHFGALKLANDTTRRNAPRIVDVVNAVFGSEAGFQPFRAHDAWSSSLPGRVELLPLCEGEGEREGEGEGEAEVKAVSEAEHEEAAKQRISAALLRNPLVEPQQVIEDSRRRSEAAQLVQKLREMVGHCLVVDKQTGENRPARYGDIKLLTRRRSVLPEFERALRAAGMPYISVGHGGLLETLEAKDLIALLSVLVTPSDNLALASALRNPVFGVSDEDLMQLAERTEKNWWERLMAYAAESGVSPALARAAHLLTAWHQAAASLPVHDLLDRIYDEGDLIARYQLAVPCAMWPGVAANLDAFIALALQLDAGRYPSLPRFLDEMKRLNQASDEEAPDEGTIHLNEGGLNGESLKEADDRLSILTIHGAKGLEAPIVWLVDAHNTHQHGDAYSVLLDWQPDEVCPRHFSLVGKKEERGNAREALFAAEAEFAAREDLNLLYVALTRAQQYFFVSGVASNKKSSHVSMYERIANAVQLLNGGEVGVPSWGDDLAMVACVAEPVALKVEPHLQPNAQTPLPEPKIAIGERRPATNLGMAWGTQLHTALEWLSEHGEHLGKKAAAARPESISALEWPLFKQAAQAIIQAPELQAFFDASRYQRALNEVEFALPGGKTGRIDRLVETEFDLWVLDYKSGSADAGLMSNYREQLSAYRLAISAIFPDKIVRCALIFADAKLLEIEF